MGAFGAFLGNDAIEGIGPFFGFLRIDVGRVRQVVRLFGHGLSPGLNFILFCPFSKTTLAAYDAMREFVLSLIRVSHCKNKIHIVQYVQARTMSFFADLQRGI
jgi:hypothetical protein